MRLALALASLLALSACGGNEAPAAEPEPETMVVSGEVTLDSVFGNLDLSDDGTCRGDRDWADLSLVITDPDGTKVGLVELTEGERPSYPDEDGVYYYGAGECVVTWSARIPEESGVFTAEVAGVTQEFTSANPRGVDLLVK